MKRRTFLATLLTSPWVAAATLGTWLQSCGSDYTAPTAMVLACDGRTPVVGPPTSGANHTHSACVSAAALAAGGMYTLTLNADYAGHTHTYTISSSDMATLQAGGMVAGGQSTVTGSHSHMVSFP